MNLYNFLGNIKPKSSSGWVHTLCFTGPVPALEYTLRISVRQWNSEIVDGYTHCVTLRNVAPINAYCRQAVRVFHRVLDYVAENLTD